jgi:hypothetical protein
MKRLTRALWLVVGIAAIATPAAAQTQVRPGPNTIALLRGSATQPPRTFIDDPKTGSFLKTQGEEAFVSGGVERWSFNASRITLGIDLLFTTDNVDDIGASASGRPRDFHLGRDFWLGREMRVPSTAYFVGNATAGYRFNNAANTTTIFEIADSGVVTLTTALRIGANHAAGGAIRLPNNTGTIFGRNQANSADLRIAYVNTDDEVSIGDGAAVGTRLGGKVVYTLAGPHAIGGSTVSTSQLALRGSFSGDTGLDQDTALTVPANSVGAMARFSTGTFVEAGSGTHSLLAGVQINAPNITAGAATVSDTASLFVAGPMTATVSGWNYAAWFDAGDVRVDGVIVTGSARRGFAESSGRLMFERGAAYYAGFDFMTASGTGVSIDGGGLLAVTGLVKTPISRAPFGSAYTFGGNDSNQWTVLTTGNIEPVIDANNQIGTSTKRVYAFVGSEYLALGTNPASTGTIRLAHDKSIRGRTSANDADRSLLDWGSTANQLQLGSNDFVSVIRTSLATPANLGNGHWWVECTGTSPSRVCALKVRDGGSDRTIASFTY